MKNFLILKSSILILKMCSYFFNFTEVINNFIYFGPDLFGYFLTLNNWQTDVLPYKLSIYHTSARIALQLVPCFVYSVTKTSKYLVTCKHYHKTMQQESGCHSVASMNGPRTIYGFSGKNVSQCTNSLHEFRDKFIDKFLAKISRQKCLFVVW